MKIRLAISDEKLEEVRLFLEERGIEIDDSAEFVLTQKESYVGHLAVKEKENGEKAFIPVEDILYIESYGHKIDVTTGYGIYQGIDPLYQLMLVLNPKKFTRISKSVIVAKNKIKQIRPSLSMKFTLIMKNGVRLEVTRSFYNNFRKEFNI